MALPQRIGLVRVSEAKLENGEAEEQRKPPMLYGLKRFIYG